MLHVKCLTSVSCQSSYNSHGFLGINWGQSQKVKLRLLQPLIVLIICKVNADSTKVGALLSFKLWELWIIIMVIRVANGIITVKTGIKLQHEILVCHESEVLVEQRICPFWSFILCDQHRAFVGCFQAWSH